MKHWNVQPRDGMHHSGWSRQVVWAPLVRVGLEAAGITGDDFVEASAENFGYVAGSRANVMRESPVIAVASGKLSESCAAPLSCAPRTSRCNKE